MTIQDTMTATHDCGFTGTLAALALHSCQIQEFGGQCEDYPCCGHTDGGGCQTTPEMTSDYYYRNPALTHLGCDHNTGFCDYEDDSEPELVDPEDCSHPDWDGRGRTAECNACLSLGIIVVDPFEGYHAEDNLDLVVAWQV